MRWLVVLLLMISSPALAGGEKMAIEDTVTYPLLTFPSYIKTIKNSIGSRVFRNLYYEVDGKTRDVLYDGSLSCAYFVSFILRHFGLICDWRTSVDGLVEEMKCAGWRQIEEPLPGSVVVWEARASKPGRKPHKHIGFYIGGGRVVSTSSKLGHPVVHGIRDGGRKVIAILFHPSFPVPKNKTIKPKPIGEEK